MVKAFFKRYRKTKTIFIFKFTIKLCCYFASEKSFESKDLNDLSTPDSIVILLQFPLTNIIQTSLDTKVNLFRFLVFIDYLPERFHSQQTFLTDIITLLKTRYMKLLREFTNTLKMRVFQIPASPLVFWPLLIVNT